MKRKFTSPKKSERGSALLVSLMVMVGLSLLGLGFVAISETESAIAANERNATQVQAVAEAGTRAVVDWFQDPAWARSQGLMPPNDANHAAIKATRTSGTYVGKYKVDLSEDLCDLPFGPAPADRFYGTEIDPDIVINDSTEPAAETAANANHLDLLNAALFGDQRTSGEITDVRIFAPPIDGGSLVADGAGKKYWVGGTRYGVATIQVTATKFAGDGTTPVARRVVRAVVGPFPLPIPGGPIQTASTQGINFGGSSDVWWGLELSAGPITDTKNPSCLPWANPYERSHIERGYDDVVWPIPGDTPFDTQNYFNEMQNRTLMDPWFGTRAFTTNVVTNPGYQYWRTEVMTQNNDPRNRFGAFAQQDADIYPDKKMVRFPDVRYDFWKKITKNGTGTKGLYYFAYDAATQKFKRNGTGPAQPAVYWVNTLADAQLSPGIFFFDTIDGTNPQRADGTTNVAKLTPALSWNSAGFGNPFRMVGFIYLNAVQFETTGSGSSTVESPFNMPGEAFRDIGYRVANPSTGAWILDIDGNPTHTGASDGVYSCQEDMNNNGRCDIVVMQKSITQTDGEVSAGTATTTTSTVWVPKPWNPAGYNGVPCTVPPANYNGTNGNASDCSEPHEPYLNFRYPVDTYPGQNSSDLDVTVGWEAGLGTQRQKKTSIACSNTMTDLDDCTSNAYDDLGAVKRLKPILDGIFYNEGGYDPAGNAEYYGAMLFKGAVNGTGNPRIYFNESLTKGKWAPAGMPRVFVYSFESDDLPD